MSPSPLMPVYILALIITVIYVLIRRRSGRNSETTSTRPLRFEMRVFAFSADGPPSTVRVIKNTNVPAELCHARAPQKATAQLLADLVNKYDAGLLKMKPWKCFNCYAKATNMVHTPMAYLHLPEPMVVDFVQPVCVHRGPCDRDARQFMAEEMSLVGAYNASARLF